MPSFSTQTGWSKMIGRLSRKSSKNAAELSPLDLAAAGMHTPPLPQYDSPASTQGYFPDDGANSSAQPSPALRTTQTTQKHTAQPESRPLPRRPLTGTQTASPTQTTFPAPHSPNSASATPSSATKFLRRVASAPNTKALFNGSFFSSPSPSPSTSATRNGYLSPALDAVPPLPVGIIPVGEIESLSTRYSAGNNGARNPKSSSSDATKSSDGSARSSNMQTQSSRQTSPSRSRTSPKMSKSLSASPYSVGAGTGSSTLSPPSPNLSSSALSTGSPRTAFRRTYSSSSIRVRSAEIGPSSFHKIKLLGKGDVGKVYLVREKKTEKLFAMKVLSKKEMIKRNKIKRALAEQVCSSRRIADVSLTSLRLGNPCWIEPSIYCYVVSLIPIRRLPVSLYVVAPLRSIHD